MSLRVDPLRGDAAGAVIDDLAALRITVFRDWPYLYDGDMDYERDYLRVYRDNPRAVIAAAFDGDNLVGAATGLPLADADDSFADALDGHGIDPATVFYCAESVLLRDWRGRGVGHKFFDIREDVARDLGMQHSAFCAVMRPDHHPARPSDYRPLDRFWRKRGYAPLQGAVARFSWRDIGAATESEKPLQIWTRRL